MRVGRDVVSGLGLSFWSLLVGLGAVPLYIRYLGIEAYGLIGFFVTLQGIFQFLDLGLSPAINREVAQAQASGNTSGLPELLRSLEVVFFGTAIVIAGSVALLAPFLAGDWLKAESLAPPIIVRSVIMIGITIACRWPVGLYLGVVMGAHRVTLANNIAIVAATAGSLGAIAVLAFVSPTLHAFFSWQAAVGLLHAAVMRTIAWRIVGPVTTRFSFEPLRRVWRFSLAMTGVALSAVLFTQLDKLILSRLLPLTQFGQYMLATTLAGALYRIVTPVYNAVYPRFSALATSKSDFELTELYRISTSLLACVLFPAAMVIIIFGKDLVMIWTGDAILAVAVAPLVGILSVGSALHGVMYMPYALQLAYGAAKLPLKINLFLMLVQVPLTIVLSIKLGALGGAIAWLVLHILYVLLGIWLTHRLLLPAAGRPLLRADIGIPLLISTATGAATWWAVAAIRPTLPVAAVAAVFTGMIAMTVSLWWSPHSPARLRATFAV